MMKPFHKITGALILSGCLLAGILAGCSTAADSKSNGSSTTQDGTYTLQVDSIDGSSVSGTIGEFTGNPSWPDGERPSDMPEMPSGDMPEMPSDVPDGISGATGERPSGDMPEMPSFDPDEMPSEFSGRGGGMGGFSAGEEKIEFTISENTVITVQSFQGNQSGTLEDIAAGSILEVTISGSKATEVTVISLMPGGGFGGSDT